MGVIYKLKPEIKTFILENKTANKQLSCRKLAVLISEKFQFQVSKSSINAVIKQQGLSLPAGRPRKKRRRKAPIPPTRIAIQAELTQVEPTKLIEAKIPLSLQPPVEKKLPKEEVAEKAAEKEIKGTILLEAADYLLGGISQTATSVFKEVRYLKVSLSGEKEFYLDGQLRTVWSVSHIPYAFSTAVYNMNSYIKKYFREDNPFVLFMAPGYDIPTKEFFDFIFSFNVGENRAVKLTLCGNKAEEIEVIPLQQEKQRFFVFGLWPWQFGQFRKVKSLGEFKPYYFSPLKKELFSAGIEMDLWQPDLNKKITLKGAALKHSFNEKICLVILSNLPIENVQTEHLINTYLNHWPNFQEGFQDFSRKIEFFTYTADSQGLFSQEAPKFAGDYQKALDAYARWYFLPQGYEGIDFSTTKQRFYDLNVRVEAEKDYNLLTFAPPPDYPFLKDLSYCLQRINEREVNLWPGKRAWFSI